MDHARRIIPSIYTLNSRSTRNQRGNSNPILATVRSFRILQLAVYSILQHVVFVFRPWTCASGGPVDAGAQGIAPSVPTRLQFRSTRNQQRANFTPFLYVLLASGR
jgi:hypothetical protein